MTTLIKIDGDYAEWIINHGFFKNLSKDLQNELPGVRGFSVKNLYYMKEMYLLYRDWVEKFPQDVGKIANDNPDDLFSISWSHHRFIIDKCKKDTDKAIFYVRKTLENNWSRNVLLNFLDTGLYERQGKAVSNFKSTLPIIEEIEKELGDNDS